MRNKVILIVDDNIFVRNLLSNIASNAGFDVVTATDGQDALDILQTESYTVDIVITDYNMPLVNGLALAVNFKMVKKYKNIPIVLYTQGNLIDYKDNVQYDVFDYIFNNSTSFKEIIKKAEELNELRHSREAAMKLYTDIIVELKITLLDLGVNLLTITGRIKSITSIYSKLNKSPNFLNNINDILGFRIIVRTVKNCYEALELLHKKYFYSDKRIKDYIKHPKNNGYQSIHIVIIGPFKKKMEIQIRTSEMHNIAENGSAAHSIYKDNIQNKEK